MPVYWKIRPLLEQHHITTYRLMKESGLAQATVYRLVNGTTHNLNTRTLDRIMTALRHLIGEEIELVDVLHYEDPSGANSGPAANRDTKVEH